MQQLLPVNSQHPRTTSTEYGRTPTKSVYGQCLTSRVCGVETRPKLKQPPMQRNSRTPERNAGAASPADAKTGNPEGDPSQVCLWAVFLLNTCGVEKKRKLKQPCASHKELEERHSWQQSLFMGSVSRTKVCGVGKKRKLKQPFFGRQIDSTKYFRRRFQKRSVPLNTNLQGITWTVESGYGQCSSSRCVTLKWNESLNSLSRRRRRIR